MPDILDVEEACTYLKITKPTVYKYARTGRLPAVKMGRIWRFHRKSLDEWMRLRVKEDTASRRHKVLA